MNGDGKLQIISKKPIFPAWVLTFSKNIKKSSNDNISGVLDKFYKLFNSEENPYTSGKNNALIDEVLDIVKNADTENRDVMYGIFLYYAFQGQKNRYLNYANMRIVLDTYLKRFKKNLAHPLLLLWLLEESISLKDNETADSLKAILAEQFPDFIPFKVYDWSLEKDPKLKQKKYKELKKKYSKHWIVKEI